LDEGRDVIERPIDESDIDLSGWDLKKALKLFRKSNPPRLEWLQSPIVYFQRESFTNSLRELLPSLYSPAACFHHYLHMAQGNYRDYLQGEIVRVKKYFYVLRPILACSWIEAGLGAVPMEFRKLLDRVLPEPNVKSEVERLLKLKIEGSELDRGPHIPILNDYIDRMIAKFQTSPIGSERSRTEPEVLDRLFRETISTSWSG
jgi:predicted nucleotidyltransferase